MTAATAASLGKRSVPKLQLIYFLITLSGIVATICGIYLSHLSIEVFQRSLYNTPVYDLESLGSSVLRNRAADLMSLMIVEGDKIVSPYAGTQIDNQAEAFLAHTQKLRAVVPKYFGGDDRNRVEALITDMNGKMSALEATAKTWRGTVDLLRLNQQHQELRNSIKQFDDMVTASRIALVDKAQERIKDLRTYEYVIGGLLILVISAGGYYGLFIGKVMRRKFVELEKAHVDLAESHEQALAFSKEIQLVNNDMGDLNRKLNENLTKLREAQDEALRKGKMAQLGNLTATVAHELRNPLSVVRTSAFLLGRKLKDKPLGVEPQLQRINNGIIRCDNIITQLLDFSRSQAVKTVPLVLDDWLEKLVQTEAQRLPEALGIECHFGLGDMLVNIEPGRFERAIINLLSNASEALVGKGDDPKAFFRANPVVTVSTSVVAQRVEIVVSDNGPGITAANLAKIREPLFTTKSFGTGLGIAAVEQILEQHGGGLDISSIEGQGARFSIWLPLRRPLESEAA